MSEAVQKSDPKASQTKAKNKRKKSRKNTDAQQRMWKNVLYFFLALTLGSLAYFIYTLNLVTSFNQRVDQLKISASRIASNVNTATFDRDYNVSSAAYDALETNVKNYNSALKQLQMQPLGYASTFNKLNTSWLESKQQLDFIRDKRSNVDDLQDRFNNEVKPAIKEIQDNYSKATEQAVLNRISIDEITAMQQQILRAERMQAAFAELTFSIESSTNEFTKLADVFYQNLVKQQQLFGDVAPALNDVQDTYSRMIAPLVQTLEESSSLPAIESRRKARALGSLADNTNAQLSNVKSSLFSHYDIVGALILFALGLLGTLFALSRVVKARNDETRLVLQKETLRQREDMEHESERAREIQEENERNQMAILRLLDELGDLAEGDLTVNATVSEDFTGAIADSVNFAIDQLRQLVLAINTTAIRVAQSSEQTQMTAMELAEASENQAQEIAGVSAAINEMVVSIDQVSMNASESASVAERSVGIAHNGVEVVQRSIEGMNTIREQIQETSKRIKRLGESSQEIGDIIGLINDIADQTNVLALNAAIQASMAGEAGRGFAVVADEVQRLAERSANATKQIETLVKTIQADTNEAVMSMETTTAEVVRGARLAKDAGEALEEVQTVSNALADLIQNISNAAQQQASSAGHISKTMNIIQDITSQTSSGTMATARSVGQLNEMAAALQESVSDFKLDDSNEMLLQDL